MTDRKDSEEELTRLLREMPSAPDAWVALASELPKLRAALDQLDRRVLDGAVPREAETAELEAALTRAGLTATPEHLEALRRLIQIRRAE